MKGKILKQFELKVKRLDSQIKFLEVCLAEAHLESDTDDKRAALVYIEGLLKYYSEKRINLHN